MSAAIVFMQSPQGDDTKEVEATAEKLTPLMAAGWHQVPAPKGFKQPVAPAPEGK
jgi:hypothetical protein